MLDYPNLREEVMKEYSMAYSNSPLKGAPLEKLDFFTGAWKGESDGDQIEEHWMPNTQNNRTGMFRWIKNDEVFVYEIMALVQRDDEVHLLLRHFGKEFECWEEKDKPMVFILTELTDTKAVFILSTKPEGGFLVYEQIDENSLVFRDLEKDGSVSFELQFSRT
jgi:hypothetical protein